MFLFSSASLKNLLSITLRWKNEILQSKNFFPGEKVFVGVGPKNHFRFPAQGLSDRHLLFHFQKDETLLINLVGCFEGEATVQGKNIPLDRLPQISLSQGSKGVIQNGFFSLSFDWVGRPSFPSSFSFLKRFARERFHRWIFLSGSLHCLLFWSLPFFLTFFPSPNLEMKIPETQKKFYFLPIQTFEISKTPFENPFSDRSSKPGGVPSLQKHGLKKGNQEKEGCVGVLCALKITSQVFDSVGISSSTDQALQNAVTSLRSTQGRESSPGEFKLGRGSRKGGLAGGSGSGTETINLHGSTSGTSLGQGNLQKGKGPWGKGRMGETVHAVLDSEFHFVGGRLSKEVIFKIIQENLGLIRFCYEQQLQKEPHLKGKISVQFVIGLQGRVLETKVQTSTLQNRQVEQCVQRAVSHFIFPQPEGGVVEVIFPFLFRTAG